MTLAASQLLSRCAERQSRGADDARLRLVLRSTRVLYFRICRSTLSTADLTWRALRSRRFCARQ